MTTSTTTTGTTMRAIIQENYGEAENVRLGQVGRPAIGDREVLLRVHAAGVDRGVWHLVAGLPYAVRLAGYGIRAPKTPVPGREVAGRVEAVGAEVRRWRWATRCSASPRVPLLSTRGPGLASSRLSPRTSPMPRPRWYPYPA
jgi:NADPH:quinone reductase-like Zn-dependent oxidoreductase